MSVATGTRRPASWGGDAVQRRGRTGCSPAAPGGEGGGPTLEESLAGVWERLIVHTGVACPVCDGEMRPEYGSQSVPVGGRCRDCGSALA